MNLYQKTRAIILLLGLFANGCNPIGQPAPPTSTDVTRPLIRPSPDPSLSATVMLTATQRLMLLSKQCLDVSSSPVWDGTGALALASRDLSVHYLIDTRTGRRSSLTKNEDDLANNFVESPDRNWLAYVGGGQNEPDMLVIQSADGQERFVYPKDFQEWDTIAYWLNNQTLVLWHHASPLDNIILFNPFTGEKRRMGLDYPGILPFDDDWNFSWPSVTIYAPSLQRLVYLATPQGGYQPATATMVLWDRQSNRPIAKINDLGFTLVIPLWKADESGLVYVKSEAGMNTSQNAEELYFLSSDGKNEQVTQLGNYFPHAIVESYSWSADERFLALNVQSVDQTEQVERYLLVLNMSNLELTDYCLIPRDFSPLIWSLDGHQLAFAEYLPDGNFQTVVIDLVKESAFSVAENLQPVGWLHSAK